MPPIFQSTVPPQVRICIFCILHGNLLHQWKARQPFYKHSCLVRLLKCYLYFTWSCALLIIMVNLYWHSFSFARSHEYIYGNKTSAIIFAVTQQIIMEYAGKNAFSEAMGKWKCPWNLPTLVINQYFKQRSFIASFLKGWGISHRLVTNPCSVR